MTYYTCFCDYFKSLITIIHNIVYSDDTYKEIYKNDILPEIWRASWYQWSNRIENKCKKKYLTSFIAGFFDFLKVNQTIYEDMNDFDIETVVKNRRTYFPSNSYILVQVYIPGMVYKVSIINEKIHHLYGKIKIMNIYKKYVMNNTYYIKEELLLRKHKSNSNDIVIDDWVLSNEFYYNYKNPVKSYYLIPDFNDIVYYN